MRLSGVEAVVRIKSMRGRGGGVERVSYERISGDVEEVLQINLAYKHARKTNASATPVVRDISLTDSVLTVSGRSSKGKEVPIVLCEGLDDSVVSNLTVGNLTLAGRVDGKQQCKYCEGRQETTTPKLCVKQQ